LANRLLAKLGVGPGLGEGAHVLEIRARKTLHRRELGAQIGRDLIDDALAPGACHLPVEDVAADPPVELQKLAVHRQGRALLREVDAGLHVREPLGVPGRPATRARLQ